MVEEYDLLQRRDLLVALGFILLLLAVGVVLETLLRALRRRAAARSQQWVRRTLRALEWQPVFWAITVGLLSQRTALGLATATQALLLTILNALGVLALTILIVRLMLNGIRLLFERQDLNTLSVIDSVLRAFGVFVVVLVMLPQLGIPTTPLLAFIASSSIGIAFILRDPIANLFSGLMIILSRRFKVGDVVRLSTGEEGIVRDIRWAVTDILQINNSLLSVPNATMVNATLINFEYEGDRLMILVPVHVSHTADLSRVESIALEVADQVVDEINAPTEMPVSMVRYFQFGDSAVSFNIILPVQEFVDQYLVRHRLIMRLHARFQAEGIPFPYPVRTLQLTNEPTITVKSHPPSQQPPAQPATE
jgi:small-conductance mechanosensitive channel